MKPATVVKKMEAKTLIAPEILAEEIRKISHAMTALARGPLKFETTILLVSRSSGVCLTDTERVLYAAQNLDKKYLK